MFKLKLHWQVLIAMALGTIFALVFGENSLFVAPLGTIFMRLLKIIIVPLIVLSITKDISSDFNAGEIIKNIAKSIGCGGGGPNHFGTAGFNDLNAYNKAFSLTIKYLKGLK